MSGNPTIDVRSGQELDIDKLDPVLKAAIPGLEGLPKVKQFPSGASNLTYLLSYANRDLVLRSPPLGTKAKGAHSMSRECNAMKGLHGQYPVPEVLYYTDDESILGVEFYVMDKIAGSIVKHELPKEWNLDEAGTERFCRVVWDKLIDLHTIDYKAAGLGDFGKPDGYVRRQIEGWNKRWNNALTEDVPAFEDVQQWLADHIPEKELAPSIIHGDFRVDNVMVAPDDPFNVVAVLDWEMATLGDPLMDLGNSLAYWLEASDPEKIKFARQQPSDAPGMLTRNEILAYYTERTGIDTSNFDFYLIQGYFRLSVIMQQIYYRYFHKQTTDERFASFGLGATILAEHCQNLIKAA